MSPLWFDWYINTAIYLFNTLDNLGKKSLDDLFDILLGL